MKTIYYLSGLPRAGNTLLSSILNQNSKINTTSPSDVNFLIYQCLLHNQESSVSKNFPDSKSFKNAISPFLYNYYDDWTGDIIIQRSNVGHWPELEVVDRYLKNDFKCIVLVRDIFEVLASFIKLYNEDKHFYLNKKFVQDRDKIEFLLSKGNYIQTSLDSIYNLYYGWYDHCVFIQYKDFINDPKKQINRIYDFFKIKSFNHFYENLKQFEVNNLKYDDSMYGKNLHKINTKSIEKSNSFEYTKFIPNEYIEKYKEINNWLNNIA